MLRRILAVCALISLTNLADLWSQDAPEQSRWASAIAKFEEQDEASPTEPGGVVFVGSSSIRMWDLEKSFPKAGYLNRGFGGSQIADSIEFAKQLVLKHKPRIVVMYAGDNDIAGGKSPEVVAGDFKKFRELLHKELPEAQLIYIAIKPSLKRWDMWPQMDAANKLISAQCDKDERLAFANIINPMLGEDGTPLPGLFAKDGLHLSEAGYETWTKVLNSELERARKRIAQAQSR
jgi:lysophospholipase L1-like esterase